MKDYKRKYKEVIKDSFPENMTITFGDQKLEYTKKKWQFNGEEIGLRYGDNPGQQAALYELTNGNIKIGEVQYVNSEDAIISNLGEETLTETGKHLGKSNLADVDAALNILKYFDDPTAVIIKHGNPSGVASRSNIKDAYVAANFADRIAAFGGALVTNKPILKETAEEILKNYLEVVAAPEFEKEATEILKTKKNMRLMNIKKLQNLQNYRTKKFIEFKSLMDGGIIAQNSADNHITEKKHRKRRNRTQRQNPQNRKKSHRKRNRRHAIRLQSPTRRRLQLNAFCKKQNNHSHMRRRTRQSRSNRISHHEKLQKSRRQNMLQKIRQSTMGNRKRQNQKRRTHQRNRPILPRTKSRA